MRNVVENQMKIGEVGISKIKFDLKSRDELPQLFMGLQHIYSTREVRDKVFELLVSLLPKDKDPKRGRPGMNLWTLFVLGTVRLICNWDYDKLHDIANNHIKLRQLLGHGLFDFNERYSLQAIKDNVRLLTPEILDQINQIVVNTGLKILGKENDNIKGRCDSFVVETDVHYPTDINLLFDAIRKVIELTADLCSKNGVTEWRQHSLILGKIKAAYRKAQQMKRSTSKDPKKKEKREELIIKAHQEYTDLAELYCSRAIETVAILRNITFEDIALIMAIETFIIDVERQIDQIRRRVIDGEKIPHEEKVFSIFQRHTEWISKGKAGVPQELGLRVCVLESQYGFILHHKVMKKQTDDKIAVEMVIDTKKKFGNLTSCSFDKGFYSPDNKKKLKNVISGVIMPKKGKLSNKEKIEEQNDDFINEKKQHSAVESAINALENHGLDRCRDHGIEGFERYVSLSITARNLLILGGILRKKKLKSEKFRAIAKKVG